MPIQEKPVNTGPPQRARMPLAHFQAVTASTFAALATVRQRYWSLLERLCWSGFWAVGLITIALPQTFYWTLLGRWLASSLAPVGILAFLSRPFREERIESAERLSVTHDQSHFQLNKSLSAFAQNVDFLLEQEAERFQLIGSVNAIREAVYALLVLTERAIGSSNLAFYAHDADHSQLWLKHVRGSLHDLQVGPLDTRHGILGSVLHSMAPLSVVQSNEASRIEMAELTHYRSHAAATRAQCIMIVPVFSNDSIYGVLVADKYSAPHFASHDLALLEVAAREVTRVIEFERYIHSVVRVEQSREKFLHASRVLAEARTQNELAEAALKAASHLCRPLLVALVSSGRVRQTAIQPAYAQEAMESHHLEQYGPTLMAISGPLAKPDFTGKMITEASSLVWMALKSRAVLPSNGFLLNDYSLFGKTLRMPGVSHAKVFPLILRDEVIGAWVLGMKDESLSPESEMMLLSLSQNVAALCANAQLNESIETMATTDSLTTLSNRRAFQEMLTSKLNLAARYHRSLSLILCDIDHFKAVNDTYGHPAGDQVLKGIAHVLQETARKTDVLGRLGGEEFAIIIEESNSQKAMQTAERIRIATMSETFKIGDIPLRITLSIGVATYPQDGDSVETLLSHADIALYQAKKSGRNCSIAYGVKSR